VTCTHQKYKAGSYMMLGNALKAMKRGEICWMGKIIIKCECGTDISHAKRVKVKTPEQYISELGIDHGKNKRRRNGKYK
jgi:hypothetical protein